MTALSGGKPACEEILDRIQAALGAQAGDPAASHARIARPYDRTGDLSREACLELFLDRLSDYDTEILAVETEAELPAAIARALQKAGERRALVAPEFPVAWLPGSGDFVVDKDLPVAEIEGVPAVVTTCEVAVASTGTILLAHEGAQGRRVLTLLPDHHICLVRRSQVVPFFPQALTAIEPRKTLPLTMISGPSATSDIEMTRVRGVHGPRRLTVVLFG